MRLQRTEALVEQTHSQHSPSRGRVPQHQKGMMLTERPCALGDSQPCHAQGSVCWCRVFSLLPLQRTFPFLLYVNVKSGQSNGVCGKTWRRKTDTRVKTSQKGRGSEKKKESQARCLRNWRCCMQPKLNRLPGRQEPWTWLSALIPPRPEAATTPQLWGWRMRP